MNIGFDKAARTFERNVTLNYGRNIISLLSVTTGFSVRSSWHECDCDCLISVYMRIIINQNFD